MDDGAAVERMERAAAAIEPAMSCVTPADLERASPCRGWSVGQVAAHLIHGLEMRALQAEGGTPTGDDTVPGDVSAAWTAAREHFFRTLAEPGALDRAVRGPGGEVPLRTLLMLFPIELMLHGWDIARGIGVASDLDPQLAEQLLEDGRPLIERFGRGTAFGPEQEAPHGATAADRLAAFYGRRVGD